MTLYFVNKNAQDNGDHEVHKDDCQYLPHKENRVPLGKCRDCRHAIAKARTHFKQVDGCYYCSRECHRQ